MLLNNIVRGFFAWVVSLLAGDRPESKGPSSSFVDDFRNYRPISITPVLSSPKMFERLESVRIGQFVDILPPSVLIDRGFVPVVHFDPKGSG